MAKKILIIEDEQAVLKVLSEKITKEGFMVLQATDGENGLALALKEHPDLILLDLVLPKIDGLVLLKKLRDDSWGANAPVMILTNLSDNKRVAEAMALGVYEYLVKSSWDIDEVIQKIEGKLGV